MAEKSVTVSCPTCGKTVRWIEANRDRPFCGERCRLIDLGEWAAEKYRVAGEPAPTPDDPESDTLQ